MTYRIITKLKTTLTMKHFTTFENVLLATCIVAALLFKDAFFLIPIIVIIWNKL